MNSAITSATTAAIPPSTNDSWNAAGVGIGIPSTSTTNEASTAPITAAATLVPSERNRALRPFEAPVSDCGTERMMSIGIAA